MNYYACTMNMPKREFAYLSLIVLAGCLPDISGDPPPSDQLIYPVGLATTSNDKYLLVANSNFDLRYNAGTLVAIDLEKVDAIRQAGGESEWVSNNGTVLHVPESELIHTDSTLRLDAFASDLETTPSGGRALVPVRGGPERHILIVDVDEEKKNGRVLSCGQNDELKCDGVHKVTSNERFDLPIEPYEVASLDFQDKFVDSDGNESTITSTIGFATHLFSGSVSAFTIENNEGKLDADLIGVVHGVVPEASGIAVNPSRDEVYVSGRKNDEKFIAILKVFSGRMGVGRTNDPFFGRTDKIDYINNYYGGTDARGIAISPSGGDAMVVTRSPEALIRVDTKSRQMTDMVSLGIDPSVVQVFEHDGRAYAFVLCFKSNNMFIVEMDSMRTYVRSTGSGPQAVAFDDTRKLAYVANFRESTISIFEAIPPFNHLRVDGEDLKIVIGKPRLPGDHN